MSPLFQSPSLQESFEADGFVKIPALLNSVDVAALRAAYATVAAAHERINIPYITTSHSNDAELITKVDEMLQSIIAPALKEHLVNYNLLFGNFLVKMPMAQSETSPHQDITFVDESRFASVNIWVALENMNEQNGCMYFLKGSHKLMPTIRPTFDYKWHYENVKQEIISQSEVFTAKAGDAFIFNHAVIHGSYSNTTQSPRLAAVIAAYSKDAQLIHYFIPNPDSSVLQKYRMTKEAFLHFKKGHPPAMGVFEGEVHYDFKQLNSKEFRSLLKGRTQNTILDKLKDWFLGNINKQTPMPRQL